MKRLTKKVTYKSPVIRQKGESQNGCFKKKKDVKFSEKRTLFTPDTHTYACISDGKKYSFFGKFGVLFLLETLFLRFPLLPCYRRNNQRKLRQHNHIITLSHLAENKYFLILIFAKSILSTRLHTRISKRSFEVERKNNFI